MSELAKTSYVLFKSISNSIVKRMNFFILKRHLKN